MNAPVESVPVIQADRDAARNEVLRVIYGPMLDRAVSVSIPAVVSFDHAVEAALRHRTSQVAELVEAVDSALWLLASILKAKDAFESDRSFAGVDCDAWEEQARALIASHKGEQP